MDDLAPLGAADFVEAVSTRLPMWTISTMLVVPEELREKVAENGDIIIGINDTESLDGRDPMDLMFTEVLSRLPGIE